jgi:hypothetical protein
MNILNSICKYILVLICIMPVLGVMGVFPEPTADMYGSDSAYSFIMALYDTGYIMYTMAAVFFFSAVLLLTNRTALAALLLLPLTVNIVGFHAFVDTGLLAGGALMGNILLLLNVYFIWKNKEVYKVLFSKQQ